jgi:peptide/nickel transport system permease protein
MSSLILRRLVQLIPTIVLLSMIIFSLQHLLPGDPALMLAGDNPDDATLAAIRAQ